MVGVGFFRGVEEVCHDVDGVFVLERERRAAGSFVVEEVCVL